MVHAIHPAELGVNSDAFEEPFERLLGRAWKNLSRLTRWLLERAGIGWLKFRAVMKRFWHNDNCRDACAASSISIVALVFSVPMAPVLAASAPFIIQAVKQFVLCGT